MQVVSPVLQRLLLRERVIPERLLDPEQFSILEQKELELASADRVQNEYIW